MNPQVLAADEITAPEDAAALETASGCGVALLASVHSRDLEELSARPVGRRLLEGRLFRRAVVIRREGGARTYGVEALC